MIDPCIKSLAREWVQLQDRLDVVESELKGMEVEMIKTEKGQYWQKGPWKTERGVEIRAMANAEAKDV